MNSFSEATFMRARDHILRVWENGGITSDVLDKARCINPFRAAILDSAHVPGRPRTQGNRKVWLIVPYHPVLGSAQLPQELCRLMERWGPELESYGYNATVGLAWKRSAPALGSLLRRSVQLFEGDEEPA